MVEQVMGELAPPELGQELRVAPGEVSALGLRRAPHRVPDLARTDLAEMQVRGEPRRAGDARRVAPTRVILERLVRESLEPVANGQTTAEELARCQADPEARIKLLETAIPPQYQRHKGPRYTPIAKRQDKPDAILYLLRNHPELSDAQICKLVGTTKPTINAVRERTHWNSPNLKARHPVGLELCTLEELDQAVTKATRGKKSLADIEAEIAARAAEAEDVEA